MPVFSLLSKITYTVLGYNKSALTKVTFKFDLKMYVYI